MTDRARRKRLSDVAAAKRRHDEKMRQLGYKQSQIWLSDLDRKNVEVIGASTELKTISEVVSFALAESAEMVASGASAQRRVQPDQNDAQVSVRSIDQE